MRHVRISKTAVNQLHELLAQGSAKFGAKVIAAKYGLVYSTINNHLASFPATKRRDRHLGLHLYPVAKTPFVLAYDFDDDELRIHFVLHASADRGLIDPHDIEW
jgi:mRNA-degrading endonuclease RelE of RelBE toxin-antitoxin system